MDNNTANASKHRGWSYGKALYFLALLFCLVATPSPGQTTVNLTVKDTPDNQVWSLGTWSVSLTPARQPTITGSQIISGGGSLNPQSGSLTGSGTASMALPANINIVPSQSVWTFTVCPQMLSGCFSQQAVVGTASPQSLTIAPPSPRVSATATQGAYSITEVGAVPGQSYFNLLSNVIQVCIASNGTACTTWNSIVSSGTVNSGNSGQIAYYASTGTGVNGFTASGDCTVAPPTFTCTKTNGVAFAPSATTDTTNANNITTGVLSSARIPAINLAASGNGGVTGLLPNANLANSTITISNPSFITGFGTVSLGGTLTPSWNSQSGNTFLAGPCSGSGTPTFRAICSADVPAINLAIGGNGGVTGLLPNSSLQNSSITINTSGALMGGGTVALGNSLTLTATVGASYNSVTSYSNTSVLGATQVLTKSVTMPSAGCPCRAIVSYSIFYTIGSQTTVQAAAYDGANYFAESAAGINAANLTNMGLNASAVTPVTYSNSANITFSVYAEAGSTITMVSPLYFGTPVLSIEVFPSN